MSARYFCDKCGVELFLNRGLTNGTSFANCDGNKTYDTDTGEWLDLCDKCRRETVFNIDKSGHLSLKKAYLEGIPKKG